MIVSSSHHLKQSCHVVLGLYEERSVYRTPQHLVMMVAAGRRQKGEGVGGLRRGG